MYVKVILNVTAVNAMVDKSATHNFHAERIAEQFSRMKQRMEAKPIAKMANDVTLRGEDWLGLYNFTAVPLVDFKVCKYDAFVVVAST